MTYSMNKQIVDGLILGVIWPCDLGMSVCLVGEKLCVSLSPSTLFLFLVSTCLPGRNTQLVLELSPMTHQKVSHFRRAAASHAYNLCVNDASPYCFSLPFARWSALNSYRQIQKRCLQINICKPYPIFNFQLQNKTLGNLQLLKPDS